MNRFFVLLHCILLLATFYSQDHSTIIDLQTFLGMVTNDDCDLSDVISFLCTQIANCMWTDHEHCAILRCSCTLMTPLMMVLMHT